MSLTVMDDTMRSTQTGHVARRFRGMWRVTWSTSLVLDYNGAISAMTIAEIVNGGSLQADYSAASDLAQEIGFHSPHDVFTHLDTAAVGHGYLDHETHCGRTRTLCRCLLWTSGWHGRSMDARPSLTGAIGELYRHDFVRTVL